MAGGIMGTIKKGMDIKKTLSQVTDKGKSILGAGEGAKKAMGFVDKIKGQLEGGNLMGDIQSQLEGQLGDIEMPSMDMELPEINMDDYSI